MSFNLIESVKEILSGDMANRMAGILGESPANVQQAIQGIIPAILAGLLLKTDSGDVQDTLNLATAAARIDIPFNLNSLAGGAVNSKGMDFLKNIFGEKTSLLSDAIADYAGISSQSASSLLSTAAPAALGVLGNHILSSNMNASGLRSFLNSQKKKVLNVLPTGIFLNGIIGIEDLSGIAEKFSGPEVPERKGKSVSKWVIPITLILIAGIAVWYFMNKQIPSGNSAQPVMDTVIPSKDTIKPALEPENKFIVKLPDGVLLVARKGGIEDQLVIFFTDPKSKASRRFPFNFDQMNFNSGTADITNESMVQIQNLASILKAFPKAKIKIGGFNEKGGDSIANKLLSESRANAVATAIKAAGANSNQIAGVEGFGSDFAKYPADAADSLREKDQRISISVRSK
ncbi:MAG TPA: OmpA family protein [Puia sp.]|jgi:outer membrane protein OmpA-like peptidoglycan-associated protein|nr:OmpA family protein [Puia sp.]